MKMPDKGVFPTMLVAYREDGDIDYNAMGELLEWYIAGGVNGIFALCHSTESHWLTMAEKLELARFVVKTVNGRVPVVMSGVTSTSMDRQLYEAQAIYETGADAIVFLRNRLGSGYDAFAASIERISNELPDDIPLGMYECPYPFKQCIGDGEFKLATECGRFKFLKDTVCDPSVMRRRAAIRDAGDPDFKLYNANCATLLDSMRFGYNGFCGIMANFHPDLYVWLASHINDSRADLISAYLGVTSVIEARSYPICAKRYLAKYEGIHMTDMSRAVGDTTIAALEYELEGVHTLTDAAREIIKD